MMRFLRLRTGRCPDPREWDVFLCGRLTETADRAVRNHLERCPSCQARLKSTATVEPDLDLRGLTANDPFIHEPECGHLRDLAMTVVLPDGVAEPPPVDDALESIRLPPEYEYLGKIAEGGMGVVLKARQRRLQRVVAIKTVRLEHGSRDDLNRFQAEAVKLARLQHPNIVPIHEAGDHGGRPFFVMEYVDGGNLLTWIRSHPPAPRRAAVLVRDVALAVAYAHSMGVVHRDLKPGNILMTRTGEPKVTDFGLAKFLDGDQHATAPGLLAGTAPYMAPEQIHTTLGPVGPAVDVYGIGAILYELLAGRPPYHGATRTKTLNLVTQGNLEPPARLRPGIPRDLELICLTCLQTNPADRYPTAAAVVVDLQRFLTGEPVHARPPGPARRAACWVKRNRSLLTASVIVALAGVGGWAFRTQVRDVELHNRRTAALVTATTDLDAGIRECEQGRVPAGLLLLARAADALPEDEVALRRVIRANLSAWAQNCCRLTDQFAHDHPVTAVTESPDGRYLLSGDESGRIVVREPGGTGPPVSLPGHTKSVTALAVNRDGRWAVSGSLDGTVRVWNLKAGSLKQTIVLGNRVQAVAVDPAGSTIVVGTRGPKSNLTAWDLLTGKPVNCVPELEGAVTDLTAGPDGTFAATTGGTTLYLWHGADVWKPSVESGQVRGVAFHPDGERLATGGDAIRLWNRRTRQLLGEWREPFGPTTTERLAFTADGRTLLLRTTGHGLRAWDTVDRQPVPLSLARAEGVRAIAGRPGGRGFLVGTAVGVVRCWSLPPVQPTPPAGVEMEPGWFLNQVGINPVNGTGFAVGHLVKRNEANEQEYLNRRLWLLSSPVNGQRPQLVEHPTGSPAEVAAFDPAGRTIACGHRNGDVLLWDSLTHELRARWRTHGNSIRMLRFDSAGRQLLSVGTDGTACVRDLIANLDPMTVPTGVPLFAADFAPRGDYFATGGVDGVAAVWRVADGRRITQVAHGRPVQGLAFSPDGSILVTAGGGTARAWRLPSGEPRGQPIRIAGEICRLAVASTGTAAVFGSDEVCHLWPLASDRPTRTVRHAGIINSAAFDGGGTTLLTAGADRTVRLWCTETGRPIGPPLVHPGSVQLAVWGEKEGIVLTASGGVIRRWELHAVVPPPGEVSHWARAWTGCELSADQQAVEVTAGK
jgi:WD40 repeat protein/tRNA A-37 threonylcarbamoyl transferase component Bud32